MKEIAPQLLDYTEKLELILNSVNAIICELDLQARITWINRFGLEFFGYREDEILRRSVYETTVPKKRIYR